MSRSKLRGVAVVVSVVVAVAVALGVFAGEARTTAQTAVKVSASLKGAASATGTFTGTVTSSGTKGSLSWKLSLKPAISATSAQIRAGAAATGALQVSLCAPCSVGAHGVKVVTGAALKSIVGGHSGLVVRTARSTLKGAVKSGSGGGITVIPTPALIAKGKALAAAKGCQGCHTLTGAKSTGPTWKGLAGSKVHLTNGKTIVATDSYLVGVITDPTSLMVDGYDATVMAEVIAPGSISTAEAESIVAYIKTIK